MSQLQVGDIVQYKRKANMVYVSAIDPLAPDDVGVVTENRDGVLLFVNFPMNGTYGFLPEFLEKVGEVE